MLALLSAACSNDDASLINAPQLVSSLRNSQSSAASLGAASSFAVLGGPAVTCTNTPPPTTINGDVGVALTAAFTNTTGCVINGQVHAGDAAALAAYNDFFDAYDAVAGQSCDHFLTGTLANVSLPPGVYCFSAQAVLTGTLTLVGGPTDTWVFKVGTSGTGYLEATNFSVVMQGGDPCNVTWWVAEYATVTTSQFIGTILAGAAITVTSGGVGTFHGRALAKAAVTITGGTLTACTGGSLGGSAKAKCNQGVGNGPEGCDPGNSNQGDPRRSNDERGGTPGNPGRKGGNGK